MFLKIILLLVALAIIKQVVLAYTKAERRRYARKKYRPKDPTDTMKYDNVKPTTATIAGKTYHFSSAAEYHYALHLQKRLQHGEITGWSYEETLFAFYPKPYRKEWKPDGVSVVMYPKYGLSVPDAAKVKAYLPDFCVAYPCGKVEYIEIKGRITQRAKTALQNMQTFYPNVLLKVLYV